MDQSAIDIPFDICHWWLTGRNITGRSHRAALKNIPMGPGPSDDRTYSVIDIERINAIDDCKSEKQ